MHRFDFNMGGEMLVGTHDKPIKSVAYNTEKGMSHLKKLVVLQRL